MLMKIKLKKVTNSIKSKIKDVFTKLGDATRPARERVARPVTKWGRIFERNFYATTHMVRVFRKTLAIAGVFSVGGLAMGSITLAGFLASAKVATMVAAITLGREAVTRLFTDRKKLSWKNEIGQEIEGTKIQKQKLTATQVQINRLSDKFNDVSGPTKYQQEKLKLITEEMQKLAKQVTVKSSPSGVSKDRYVFALAAKKWQPL